MEDEILIRMDVALNIAVSDYPENGTAKDVELWYEKHFLSAGHKRLGRFLVQRGRKQKIEEV